MNLKPMSEDEKRIKYLEDSYQVTTSLIGLIRWELKKDYPEISKMRDWADYYYGKFKDVETEYLHAGQSDSTSG